VASNPGQIPAGGREKISVKVSTHNRGGQTLHKGFTVYTNDPKNSKVRLQVSGRVNAYLTVEPQFVRFIGRTDQPLKQSVIITPLKGHPVTIKEVKVLQPENLHYKLKPLGLPPGKSGYELVVENAKLDAGSYQDRITIVTDSEKKPSITIPVYARIQGPPDPGKQKSN
jgi:hypothetical protein